MNQPHLLQQEKASYSKISAPCSVFGECGGCALQDLSYEDQLHLKRQRLGRAFEALGEVPPFELIGLEEPWRYRNKAELTFAGEPNCLTLGFHAAGSFLKIVDLNDCLLLPEFAISLLQDVRLATSQTGLSAYHPRTHQGFFRYLIVRISQATGKALLCLITAPGSETLVRELASQWCQRHPNLISCYWGVTCKVADSAAPETLILLEGQPYLEERLGPFRLKLHPLSFLQASCVQADRAYRLLCENLGDAQSVAWDLYCGVGLISFYLSCRMRQIYGIDIASHHLELAKENAALNGVQNVEFRAGSVETLLKDRLFWFGRARPDIVVVDPPRAGLNRDVYSSILSARPWRIAYFSCNIESLVRDLKILLGSYPRYRLIFLRAFDMFPQTNHAEVFALLQR